jgi:two-component system sensor histidine kinase/response regulator
LVESGMSMETKAKILVIDDEAGIRQGCRRALEPQGYIVETASTIQEGQLAVQEADYDLILLDVMMPEGMGVDMLEGLHKKDPDLVVIIITGYATVELAVEAIRRGAYDFISKPFTSDLLLMTVLQGLERRRLSLETRRLQAIEQEAAELARAKEEAEQLNTFKTAFTTMVAHELRSPVGGAQSLLRVLLRGLAGELTDKQREILGRVEARMDELMDLINDLLTLAASKTITPDEPLKRVPLRPQLQNVIDRFSAQAQDKHIRLIYTAPEENVEVQATEDGLDKIFSNLISNAIKYTPEGGEVRINVTADESRAKVSVSDTGIGIPQDALSKIWDEFYRAKNAKKTGITGTGLGLSIARQYAETAGGSIDVQSVEGEGTTFTVVLQQIAPQ